MIRNIEKIKLLMFFLISSIGFTSGINFLYKLEEFEIIKKCFEFGMYAFFQGQSFYKVFFSLIISALKNFLLMFIGQASWWIFPLVPLNLFGLSFKMGIVACFVLKTLRNAGIFECLFIILIVFMVLLSVSLYSYCLLNRRLYHSRYKKIDYTDVICLKNFLIYLACFCCSIIVIYLISIAFKLHLYGFFKTFL